MRDRTVCAILVLFLAAGVATGADLVKNPSFENADGGAAADWSGGASRYCRDATTRRSGEASLKYANVDPAAYLLCSQPVPLAQGKMYEISAWVKTQDLVGEESGATLCVEWYDSQGKYAGGCYPQGVKGTADWTLVKGVTARIPPEAAGCSISCYMRQGMTGTAWWDDVSVTPYVERPLSCVLMSPNYRNQVLGPNPDPIRVRCFVTLTDLPLQLGDVLLLWQVRHSADPSAVLQGKTGPLSDSVTDIAVDATALPDGRYSLQVALVPRDGSPALVVDDWTVSRRREMPERTAFIDSHNRLILNGEPFFPLGMYWGGLKPEELDVYAQSAFNCLMPYAQPTAEMLDMAQARGLKVIASVKDSYFGTSACIPEIKAQQDELPYVRAKVESLRGHPALLAWYINDELPLDTLPRLSTHRQWIEELDPNHPAWAVLYQVDQVRAYLPSYDVIGTDPYPIPDKDPAMAGEYARKMNAALCGSRAMWQVPQVFNWANYRNTEADKAKCRAPSLEEMRSMAWQSIAEGATGIVFYSWFDLHRDPTAPFDGQWVKVKTVAQEISAMIPVLLSVETPPKVDVAAASWLNSLVKQRDGLTHVVLVNHGAAPQTARVALPSAAESVTEGVDGKTIAVTGDGTGIELAMEPLSVHVLKIRWRQ